MAESQSLHPNPSPNRSIIPYLIKTTAFITSALTIAGGAWYVAVNLTTASDLTAIYNCSAFFAYAFSIPILKDKLRLDKVFSVAIAIIGVLIVAYGDRDESKDTADGTIGQAKDEAEHRLLGNILIGVGSVLYGLYEVLYKRFACPPEGTNPVRSMIFANAFASMFGCFTVSVLWIPLPILHFLGWETFEWPTGEAGLMMMVSIISNASKFFRLHKRPSLSRGQRLIHELLYSLLWFLFGSYLSHISGAFLSRCSSHHFHRCHCRLATHRPAAFLRIYHRRRPYHCGFLPLELELISRNETGAEEVT